MRSVVRKSDDAVCKIITNSSGESCIYAMFCFVLFFFSSFIASFVYLFLQRLLVLKATLYSEILNLLLNLLSRFGRLAL